MLSVATGAVCLTSCEDEVSTIGSTISDQQVSISVDSAIYNLNGVTLNAEVIDARSTNNLLGHINVPEYGTLAASYVTRLLSADNMQIPDSITVNHIDSMRMVLEVPRATIVGDSVAPQQLQVFRLTRQLPSDIKSNFDPEGYYDPSDPLGTRNYTLSGLALSDSAFHNLKVLPISVTLPTEWARETFTAYRETPEVFQWPSSFNGVMPGLYIKPTFGRGCIAAVQATRLYTYWHYTIERTVVEDSVAKKVPVLMKDSICLFSSAPEVLASNNLKYAVSEKIRNMVSNGDKIITTPLGYNVRFSFPGRTLLNNYYKSDKELAVINSLTMAIPAEKIENDYGITPPPSLLMIRTSEIEDFFANSKVPDNLTSFVSEYNADNGRYDFNQMRNYIVYLNSERSKVSDEEFEKLCDFTLIPVTVTSESVTDYNNNATKYVTGCTPYLERPSMTRLDTENAVIIFTYTHQYIE